MKKLLILIALFASHIAASAQSAMANLNGTLVETKDFSDVKGSPYLNDDWAKATVQLSNNAVYNNIDVKFSQYEDKLYFKGKNDELMSFATPVKEFTINYSSDDKSGQIGHYRSGYTNIPGVTSDSYVEVLADGKTQLVKRTTKRIDERVVYPSTSSNKFFVTLTKYYIVKADGKAELVNRDKKSVLGTLGDKQEQLEAYIKTNSISFKKEDDIAKLITYYNSI